MTAVGFIGTGAIAAPMARALARAGHEVFVSDRNARTAAGLAAAKWALATPNTLNLQMVEGLAADGAFDGFEALLDRISASMKD